MSSEPIPLRRQQNTASAGVLADLALKPAPDLLLESEVLWDKYKLPIVAAFVIVLLGLIGSEVYRSNRNKSLAEASAELDTAKTVDDYKKIIAKHDGSLAAAGAYLLTGRLQMNAKDYAGAAETWKTFADKYPKHPLAPNALAGAAGALESEGKFDLARNAYQRLETGYAKSYLAPLASLSEASMLKSQGKLEDARHVYENIIANAPQSDAARQATASLRLLKAIPSLPADPVPAPSPQAPPVAAPLPFLPAPVEAAPSPAVGVTPAPDAAATPSAAPAVDAVPAPVVAPAVSPSASAAPGATPSP